ncbi:MAG: hypothetical protein ABJF50_08900 [Paracoccaceae bacterium]
MNNDNNDHFLDSLSGSEIDDLLQISLLGNRAFVHDFRSPFFTINNAFELFGMIEDTTDLRDFGSIVDMVGDSISEIDKRLRYIPQWRNLETALVCDLEELEKTLKEEFGASLEINIEPFKQTSYKVAFPSNMLDFVITELARNGFRHGVEDDPVVIGITIEPDQLILKSSNRTIQDFREFPTTYSAVTGRLLRSLNTESIPKQEIDRGLDLIYDVVTISNGKWFARYDRDTSMFKTRVHLPIKGVLLGSDFLRPEAKVD